MYLEEICRKTKEIPHTVLQRRRGNRMLIKVYLVNGKHIDIEVLKDAKAYAETLLCEGVWGEERGEKILYAPFQIFSIRLVKPKPAVKKA